ARSVQLPLGDGRWATLQAPFPFSEEDWTLMLGVLNAMKPGLVSPLRRIPIPGGFAGVKVPSDDEDTPEDTEECLCSKAPVIRDAKEEERDDAPRAQPRRSLLLGDLLDRHRGEACRGGQHASQSGHEDPTR